MAKANLAPVEDEKTEPAQLALFEGEPVHEYKASLTAAGWLEINDQLKVGARVNVTSEGYVSKVIHAKKNGIITRQHVVVIDGETTEILAKE